ncbi:hypothetical protein WJX72_009191 [[Myrmecia] bisecta]|uniref:NB-ARC domain-containing protein n=1 Tax=[Myrmecia] bisecta TaxID=41462 RepID=A0AAW1PXI6_9CHLO
MATARVALVIDDVWTDAQRDALLVQPGAGSRVLVTTRSRWLVEESLGPEWLPPEEIQPLPESSALELFCWHAFGRRDAPPGYEGLADKATNACAGLPLTLTVAGGWFRRTDKLHWNAALRKLRDARPFGGGNNAALWGKLKLSYDALKDEPTVQRMFLDIACFAIGKPAELCTPAWGQDAELDLQNLINRSLMLPMSLATVRYVQDVFT